MHADPVKNVIVIMCVKKIVKINDGATAATIFIYIFGVTKMQ